MYICVLYIIYVIMYIHYICIYLNMINDVHKHGEWNYIFVGVFDTVI